MVSLVDELEKVATSIVKIERLYDIFKFVIIVPEKDINIFIMKLKSINKVEILNENEIVNKKNFFDSCSIYLKDKKGNKSF